MKDKARAKIFIKACLMELKFDKLLSVNIKRIARPKFKHDYLHLNDPAIFGEEASKGWQETGVVANDVSYGGLPADANLTYASDFGRIFTGEQFCVILTVMNVSANYALTKLRITVKTTRSTGARQ